MPSNCSGLSVPTWKACAGNSEASRRAVADRGDLVPTDVERRHQAFKPRSFVLGSKRRDCPIGIESYGGPMRSTEALGEPLNYEIPTDRHNRSSHMPRVQEPDGLIDTRCKVSGHAARRVIRADVRVRARNYDRDPLEPSKLG